MEEARLKAKYNNALDKWERLEAEREAFEDENPDPTGSSDEEDEEEDYCPLDYVELMLALCDLVPHIHCDNVN